MITDDIAKWIRAEASERAPQVTVDNGAACVFVSGYGMHVSIRAPKLFSRGKKWRATLMATRKHRYFPTPEDAAKYAMDLMADAHGAALDERRSA